MRGSTTTVGASKTRVYLDQNVFSHMVRFDGDWRTSPYATVLKKHESRAEVWLSPALAVELILCPDKLLRRKLAESMLELSQGRRMMSDFATEAVRGLLAYTDAAFGSTVTNLAYVDYYDQTLKQIFIGSIALMACGLEPDRGVIDDLTRMKLEGRWLRAEAGCDPGEWVKRVLDCAQHLRLTVGPARSELSVKPLQELVAEIHEFETRTRRIEAKDRNVVERHRADFVLAYAIGDVFGSLASTLGRLPCDFVSTFELDAMLANWTVVGQRLGTAATYVLGKELEFTPEMINEIIRSMWSAGRGIPIAEISQEVLLRDYMDRLNETPKELAQRVKKEGDSLPTDSLTFDADHGALALTKAHVFVTRDQVLLNSCKTISEKYSSKIKWKCDVVFSPEQLDKALASH